MKLRVKHLYYDPESERYFSAGLMSCISFDGSNNYGDSIELSWVHNLPLSYGGGMSPQVEDYPYLIDLGYNDLNRKPSLYELMEENDKLRKKVDELENI